MGIKDHLASLWIRRRVYRRAAVFLVAVLAVLLLALPILAAGEPVNTDRPAPVPTAIHVQLEPGQRMYFLCGDSPDDHYALAPPNRQGGIVDCLDGDIAP